MIGRPQQKPWEKTVKNKGWQKQARIKCINLQSTVHHLHKSSDNDLEPKWGPIFWKTHKMVPFNPKKKEVSWVLGIHKSISFGVIWHYSLLFGVCRLHDLWRLRSSCFFDSRLALQTLHFRAPKPAQMQFEIGLWHHLCLQQRDAQLASRIGRVRPKIRFPYAVNADLFRAFCMRYGKLLIITIRCWISFLTILKSLQNEDTPSASSVLDWNNAFLIVLGRSSCMCPTHRFTGTLEVSPRDSLQQNPYHFPLSKSIVIVSTTRWYSSSI